MLDKNKTATLNRCVREIMKKIDKKVQKKIVEAYEVHSIGDTAVMRKFSMLESGFLSELEKLSVKEPQIKVWMHRWGTMFKDIPSLLNALKKDKRICADSSLCEKIDDLMSDYFDRITTFGENLKKINQNGILIKEAKLLLFEQSFNIVKDKTIVYGKMGKFNVVGVHHSMKDNSLFELFDLDSARMDHRNPTTYTIFDPIPEGYRFSYSFCLGESRVRGKGFSLYPTEFTKTGQDGAVVIRKISEQKLPQLALTNERYNSIKKAMSLLREISSLNVTKSIMVEAGPQVIDTNKDKKPEVPLTPAPAPKPVEPKKEAPPPKPEPEQKKEPEDKPKEKKVEKEPDPIYYVGIKKDKLGVLSGIAFVKKNIFDARDLKSKIEEKDPNVTITIMTPDKANAKA